MLVTRPYRPIASGELHELRAGNLPGEVAARFDALYRIAAAMDDERRRLNRRQHGPDIEL